VLLIVPLDKRPLLLLSMNLMLKLKLASTKFLILLNPKILLLLIPIYLTPLQKLISDTKVQLSLFQDNVLDFTDSVRIPIHRLIKAKDVPSFQNFLTVLHGCMDESNEEFRALSLLFMQKEYRARGPAKSLTMLELLDKFDSEYSWINNLGRWVKCENPKILALTVDNFYIAVSAFFFERKIWFSSSSCGQNQFTTWTYYSFSHCY
jgi:hypothetical protein